MSKTRNYLSDKLTEKELDELEMRIAEEYSNAFLELKERAEKYFSKFESAYEEKKMALEAGEITDTEFQTWYRNALMNNAAWDDKVGQLAERVTQTNKVASAYINDTTPSIYSLNANYEAYRIAQASNMSFSIYSEQTVKDLIMRGELRLPQAHINTAIDIEWNKKKMNSVIISGILQGKPVREMAKQLKLVTDSNRHSAMRNARTAVTMAQNQGRQNTFERAEDMGIEVQKEWLSTLDGRTRDSHRDMDGERVPVDSKFSNGLMFPADPDGEPSEVYNCRCTMIASMRGINDEPRQTFWKWAEEQDYYDPKYGLEIKRHGRL